MPAGKIARHAQTTPKKIQISLIYRFNPLTPKFPQLDKPSYETKVSTKLSNQVDENFFTHRVYDEHKNPSTTKLPTFRPKMPQNRPKSRKIVPKIPQFRLLDLFLDSQRPPFR